MLEIRDATAADAASVSGIYNHYILNTIATFEEQPYRPGDFVARIAEVQQRYAWLVAVEDGQVVGYAYASPWRPRAAFRHTLESTIYLDAGHCGKGIGTQLYGALLDRVRSLGFHTLIAVISLPNPGSIALHEHFAYRQVGVFRQVGHKFGQWIDVAQWQYIFPG